MSYQILPYDEHSPLLYHAARVYATVWSRSEDDGVLFFRRYARQSGFCGFVARVDLRVVGMVFGTASVAGQWWHDKVAEQIGDKHPALQNAWVLTELAVLEQFRTRHIGADLHDRVIQAQNYQNLLLSTQVSNTPAQEFYRRRGWGVLHEGFAFNRNHEPYMIMHRAL